MRVSSHFWPESRMEYACRVCVSGLPHFYFLNIRVCASASTFALTEAIDPEAIVPEETLVSHRAIQ